MLLQMVIWMMYQVQDIKSRYYIRYFFHVVPRNFLKDRIADSYHRLKDFVIHILFKEFQDRSSSPEQDI